MDSPSRNEELFLFYRNTIQRLIAKLNVCWSNGIFNLHSNSWARIAEAAGWVPKARPLGCPNARIGLTLTTHHSVQPPRRPHSSCVFCRHWKYLLTIQWQMPSQTPACYGRTDLSVWWLSNQTLNAPHKFKDSLIKTLVKDQTNKKVVVSCVVRTRYLQSAT